MSHVFENAVATLSDDDRKLPQVLSLLPLLQRGVAVHHSGMLPLLRELVEILFQARDIPEIWPRCGRDVAEIWTRCGRDIICALGKPRLDLTRSRNEISVRSRRYLSAIYLGDISQENLVKLLFATETFAMGLNMPAKTVIFADLTKFDGAEIYAEIYTRDARRDVRRDIYPRYTPRYGPPFQARRSATSPRASLFKCPGARGVGASMSAGR